MVKYSFGFAASPIQAINFSDAVLRTAHAVGGYLTFAFAVALAASLRPARCFVSLRERAVIERRELEPVA